MSRTDSPDGPDDVDAIFGEIVADLRAEGVGTRSDVEPSRGRRSTEPADADPAAAGDDTADSGVDDGGATPADSDTRADNTPWRTADVGWDDTMLDDDLTEDDDEHFVPPEPPPIPKPPSSVLVVGLFFLTGLVLLIAPHIIGIGTAVGTPLGILALAAGLGFLLLHARDDPRPPGADPDNGAQV